MHASNKKSTHPWHPFHRLDYLCFSSIHYFRHHCIPFLFPCGVLISRSRPSWSCIHKTIRVTVSKIQWYILILGIFDPLASLVRASFFLRVIALQSPLSISPVKAWGQHPKNLIPLVSSSNLNVRRQFTPAHKSLKNRAIRPKPNIKFWCSGVVRAWGWLSGCQPTINQYHKGLIVKTRLWTKMYLFAGVCSFFLFQFCWSLKGFLICPWDWDWDIWLSWTSHLLFPVGLLIYLGLDSKVSQE